MSDNSPDLPCASNPDLWFSVAPVNLEYAKKWCNRCPIKQACLEGALERREAYGVFGAMTAAERDVLMRRMDSRQRELNLLARPFQRSA